MFCTGFSRRLLFSIVLIIFGKSVASGQTIGEIRDYFNRQQFQQSAEASLTLLKKSNEPEAVLIAGRSLLRLNRVEEARPYLQTYLKLGNTPNWAKAWAYADMGLCSYYFGDYEESKSSLNKAIELNATENATAFAKANKLFLGFDTYFDDWSTKRTEHFVFHFQDTSAIPDLTAFIVGKEKAFNSINQFFAAKLPKKIDYYVWNSSEDAQAVLGFHLARTKMLYCVTHTDLFHTIGHEMTHSISFFAAPYQSQNRLISEGICVYFDQSKRDNVKVLKGKNMNGISIKDIWNNSSTMDEAVIYPLGGELVKRLIESFGKEKFMALLNDQSYENAKKIYGADLEMLIAKLEKDLY